MPHLCGIYVTYIWHIYVAVYVWRAIGAKFIIQIFLYSYFIFLVNYHIFGALSVQ